MTTEKARPPHIVLSAMCRLVDLIDQKLLLAHAPGKYLHRHRPIPKNIPILRKSLRLELQSSGGHDDLVKRFLRLAPVPELGAVPNLSEQFLSMNVDDLANFFGRPEFLAACWLDDRGPVRELVFSRSEEWVGENVSDEERERATELISRQFGFVHSSHANTGPGRVGAADEESKTEPSAASELAQRLLESERQREILAGRYEKKINKLQAIIEKQGAEIQTHQASSSVRRDREHGLTEDNKALRGKLLALEQATESRVRLAVAQQFEHEVCRWLWQPRAVEAKLTEADADDLLARATQLLERQRAHDRHYGNIEELRDRIHKRREVLEQLEHALSNSLRPLPELSSTIGQLQEEIDNLCSAMAASDRDMSPLATSMLARVKGITSFTELNQVRNFVATAESFSLLSGLEQDQVNEALDVTHERLLVPYDVAPNSADASRIQRKHGLFDAVREGRSFVLFLDGHNILYRASEVFGEFFDYGQPGARARERLTGLVVGIFQKMTARVALFFDGSEPATEVHSDKVKVIYSGGEGKNRADDAMLAEIEELLHACPDERVFLVSSDFHLLKEATRRGASTMLAEEFVRQFVQS